MKNVFNRSLLFLTVLATMFAVVISPVSADAAAPDTQTAKFEVNFMEDMIDHHVMAVMMVEMCIMKAIHPELLATCEVIITTQSQEIESMQMWLQDWYGISYELDMSMGGMEGHITMDPTQFEVWFMKRMITHHVGALKEAEDCLENAYHSELIGMYQDIIFTQSQEMEMMQTWLLEWYGVCNYRKNL